MLTIFFKDTSFLDEVEKNNYCDTCRNRQQSYRMNSVRFYCLVSLEYFYLRIVCCIGVVRNYLVREVQFRLNFIQILSFLKMNFWFLNKQNLIMLFFKLLDESSHSWLKSQNKFVFLRVSSWKSFIIDSLKPFLACKDSADFLMQRDQKEGMVALDFQILVDFAFGRDLKASIAQVSVTRRSDIDTVDFGSQIETDQRSFIIEEHQDKQGTCNCNNKDLNEDIHLKIIFSDQQMCLYLIHLTNYYNFNPFQLTNYFNFLSFFTSSMHSQELLAEIKNKLFTDPQHCIQILSSKTFSNNLFQSHITQLTQLLETALQKANKENKSLSYATPQNNQPKRSEDLNVQLIVCMYSIIIMKSTSKSVVASQETPVFNTKLALETLTKIHKQIKIEDIRKIVSALLLKIPNFNNHKTIIKDISPQFVSFKTMEKASSAFRAQCPNLFQQKLLAHKDSEWGKFLSYKPFQLDTFADIFNRLIDTGTSSNDANSLIQIRQELKKEFEFLMTRISIINKEEFGIFQFCEKFTQLYRIKLQFSKLLEGQRFTNNQSRNSTTGTKNMPNYNINQLRLKVLLEGKNQLLMILTSLVKKISTYWTRKLKWLYDFITERIEIYGLQELGLSSIQEPNVYIEKLNELKLLIKLAHTYYNQFGEGLFPEDKLKALLFTQEYSFYKMIEALLYNEYQFNYHPETNRIVNYQKAKKVSQESKNKKNLIKTINVNSKSLNINPHYDLVFQKVIEEITYKNGESFPQLRQLIQEALKFICSYYKNSETYFYGGNLISMIENCKNSQIPKQKIHSLVKQIKSILYPSKKMTKQGLEFFCEEVFENYISKKRLLELGQNKDSTTFMICKAPHIAIHSSTKIEAYNSENKKGAMKKTKSYDMLVEGWNNENQQNPLSIQKQMNPKLSTKESEIFYSIKECNVNDEKDGDRPFLSNNNQKFESFKQNESGVDEMIITPDF